MRYTSWDRGDRDKPRLLAEEGPLELGVFDTQAGTASVGAETWSLAVDKDMGASATLDDGRVYRLAGRLAKDEELNASLDGRSFTLINENSSHWIIEDANGDKVAQFSGQNSGVRAAILEFEGETELAPNEIVALSWFARTVLESRMEKGNNVLIIFMLLLALVAVIVWLT
ncbi:hypothetical protein [Corynebacterium guangdongense]|uniref:Uncharacterized protein n=1 Tax=Corynebacterium guangdongense TaxID=1783348 RepID=A0ABU1ZYF7_9CORY|nr:hypothetical protein [Corynebacterium guangdongense]MDR7329961.1 hypothetical protein [Corynebacterium guangdongense]WJZ18519.1 hypothetical protein CGUA_09825 [Corynebacterium guangdongense]